MKKLNLKNNIYLVARKSDNTKGKLDYYLRMQDGTERNCIWKWEGGDNKCLLI